MKNGSSPFLPDGGFQASEDNFPGLSNKRSRGDRGKLIRPSPGTEMDISGVGIGQIVSSVSISRAGAPGFYHDQHDGVETFNQQTGTVQCGHPSHQPA